MQNISKDVILGLPKTLGKHAISLVPRAYLPNLPCYRENPKEHVEPKRQVDLKLSSVEVVKNTSVNQTTDKSPYDEIVYDLRPRSPINFIPIANHCKVSESTSSLTSPIASHVHELHKEISDKITRSNTKYEL